MNFIDLIGNFLKDPNLSKVSNWMQRYNIFDICPLSETKHSSMIAWLLNPNESHKLGEFIFKQLLKEVVVYCTENSGSLNTYTKFIKKWNLVKIDNSSFSNIFIEKELKAGANNGKGSNNAIDIGIFDYSNSIAIFIENKYGSLDRGKTEDYYDYLEKKYTNFSHRIYIYLDAYERNSSVDNNWLKINYDWIIESINSVVESHKLCGRFKKFIKDYADYVSESYSELYHQDYDEIFPRLKQDHRHLLDLIKSKTFKAGNKYIELQSVKHEDLGRIDAEPDERNLILFYWKYKDIIDTLYSCSFFELISNETKRRFPNTDIDFEEGKVYLSIYDKEWDKYSKDNDYWCLFLTYHHSMSENKSPEIIVTIKLNLIKDEYLPAFYDLIKKHKGRKNANSVKIDKTIKPNFKPENVAHYFAIKHKKITDFLFKYE